MSEKEFDIEISVGKTAANYWRDLFRFRELFYILAWRDIKVKYKQTVIGYAWAIIRPLLTTIILVVVFNKIAMLSSPIPYPIIVLSGYLPWAFFATGLSEASNSLVANTNLITKVYFPRLIIPASSIIASVVDFLVTFVLLFVLMAYFQHAPSLNLLLLPVIFIVLFVLTFGTSLFFTALNVKYRDIRYVIPFIVQFGLYVSPVGFGTDKVPAKWRTLFSMNPMVGVIDAFRWCVTGIGEFPFVSFAISTVFGILLLILGISYFRATERSFADNI